MKLLKLVRVDDQNYEVGTVWVNPSKIVSITPQEVGYLVQLDMKFAGTVIISRESFEALQSVETVDGD